jgi:hypothetical protein
MIHSRIDIDGKKYSDFKTAKITKSVGDANYASNFSIDFDNFGGIYADDFTVNDDVEIYLSCEYMPLGMGQDYHFIADNTTKNISEEFDETDGLTFYVNYNINSDDQIIVEETVPMPQPYCWLKLDGDANDYSGNGYNGTVVNGGFNQGKENLKCFTIGSGPYDYIDVLPGAMSGLSNFSVCLWNKFNFITTGLQMVTEGKTNVGSYSLQFRYYAAGSLWQFLVQSGAGLYSYNSYQSSKAHDCDWHHYAFIRSGASLSMYEDSINIPASGTEQYSSTALNISGLHIGQSNNTGLAGSPYNGSWGNTKISDFRVYDMPLNQTQITTIFERGRAKARVINQNTEAKWFKGNNTTDSGFNAVNAFAHSGATFSSTGGVDSGSCYSLPGSPAYFVITEPHLSFPYVASGASPRSLFAWVNCTGSLAATTGMIFATGSRDTSGAFFMANVGGSLRVGGWSADIDYPNFWVSGAWQHAGVVYNGSYAFLYGNGSLLATEAAEWSLKSQETYIGKFAGNQFFQGKIQDLRVFNKALTSSEVTTLYNGGAILTSSLSTGYSQGKEGYSADYRSANTGFSTYTDNSKIYFDGTKAQSFGCWYKTSQLGTLRFLMGKMFGADTGYKGMQLYYADSTSSPSINLSLYTVNVPTTALHTSAYVDLSDNIWHHVFVTYDGSCTLAGTRIYVDGELLPLNNNSTLYGNFVGDTIEKKSPLIIGNRYDNIPASTYGAAQSEVDDVRIYNKELTGTEVRALYNKTNRAGYMYGKPNLLAWYPLTYNANDYSGNGKDASVIGIPKEVAWYKLDGDVLDSSGYGRNGSNFNVIYAPGKVGTYCGQFNGSTSCYLTYSGLSMMGSKTPCSISAWIKPTVNAWDAYDSMGIVNAPYCYMNIRYTSSMVHIRTDNPSGARVVAGSLMNGINTWNHVVGIYDGKSGLYLYINGSYFGADINPSGGAVTTYVSSGNLQIGKRLAGATGSSFKGYIEDVRIYDKILSQADVTRLYNFGSGTIYMNNAFLTSGGL